MGAGTLLSPFVPLLAGDAEAQGVAYPKRLIVFFHPNGYGIADSYFPTGTETNFTLSEILQPLAAHQADIVVFKGINNPSGPDSGDNVHIPHMGSILTGTPIQRGANTPFFEGSYQYGWANGVSVDQFIAQSVGKATPFPSLDYHVVGNSDAVKTQCRMSYLGPAMPVSPEPDPQAALKRILGTGGGTGTVDAQRRAESERRSVLDFLKGDLARVNQRIGASDRARLDGHLTALRELESRLMPPGGGGAPMCKSVPIPTLTDLRGPTTYRDRGKAFLDVLVQALACDATRVIGLQWANTGGAGGVTFTWLGMTADEHSASHRPQEGVVKVKTFYMEQLAYLISELKKVPDGMGTLFDSTLILVASEHGYGATHDAKSIPFLLAGNARGAFKTGRFLQYQGAPQNQLLVSVCNAVGVAVGSFGSTKYAAGPLPGLA